MTEKEFAVCGVCGTVSWLEVHHNDYYGVVNVIEVKCEHGDNVELALGFEPDQEELA